MQKLLTISVAAYNGAATLAKALNSCIVPEREQIEVIVVDDGSTDETAQIAERYVEAFPGTFLLIRQKNRGYGSTIRAALDAASGRYFRTLDCDDWFEEGSLNLLLAYLNARDTDIVYTNYQTVRNGQIQKQFAVCEGYDPGKCYGWEELGTVSPCMEMHSMTFKTDMLRRADLALPEHCNYTDILYTFCGVQAAQTVSFVPVMLYCYLLGREGQSVSLESYQKHMDEYIRVAFLICKRTEDLRQAGLKKQILLHRACCVAQEVIELFLRFPVSKETKRNLLDYYKCLRQDFPNIASRMKNKTMYLLPIAGGAFYVLIAQWHQIKIGWFNKNVKEKI